MMTLWNLFIVTSGKHYATLLDEGFCCELGQATLMDGF